MAAVFTGVLLAYYAVLLRGGSTRSGELARLLWIFYFALGVMAIIGDVFGVIVPNFPENYPAILFLALCVLVGVTGFLGFRSSDVRHVILTVRGQGLIELILLGMQAFSILFFLPFALSSFAGDVGANRIELASKAEIFASYGIVNTIAGMGSHLFAFSMVMAFIRLSQPQGAGFNPLRATLLLIASLSYVIYILAYVGRDGSIYWLMTALLLYVVFRPQLRFRERRWIITAGSILGALVLLPIVIITIGRFAQGSGGLGEGFWEYFGAQIRNFSDYSSIYRPPTYGSMNFPIFWESLCPIFSESPCVDLDKIAPHIQAQYLAQGQPPWLFGTYVSDFVADFGFTGALLFLSGFALICHRACVGRNGAGQMTLARLLMVLFLFLTPYFGVFYFRFGIINSFLLINLLVITLVWVLQSLYPPDRLDLSSEVELGPPGHAGPQTFR